MLHEMQAEMEQEMLEEIAEDHGLRLRETSRQEESREDLSMMRSMTAWKASLTCSKERHELQEEVDATAGKESEREVVKKLTEQQVNEFHVGSWWPHRSATREKEV